MSASPPDPDGYRALLVEAMDALRGSAAGDATMAEVLRGLATETARTRAAVEAAQRTLDRATPYLERLEAHDRADDTAARAQAYAEGRAKGREEGLAEAEAALSVPRAAGASTVEILRSRGGKAALGAILLALVAAILHLVGIPVPASLQALLGGADGAG